MSWIIIYANCIFSLYAFPFTQFENDDECDGDLIADGRIFNMPFLFALFNSFYTFVIFNNSVSSSCFFLYSLLFTSFSLAILYNFSITLFTLMLPWTLKLKKCAQLRSINANCFRWLLLFSILEHLAHRIHFFTYPLSFN
jgi:hypothetical protein